MSKLAVITGVGGMDGFYLSHHLLANDYRVIGILRRTSTPNDGRLRTLKGSPNFNLVYGDITDATGMADIVSKFQPDEFYHLAANSFVGCSWDTPAHVMDTNAIGTINCLEAIRQHKKDCRFYFAGSSEMYGDYIKKKGGRVVLDEDTPMCAASPYGVSKVAGYQMTKVYRESYDMFTTCGILFNHSDTLRGTEFFTRKVTHQLAKVYWGTQKKVTLGNLDFYRDEGASRDYVRMMHLMLQHNEPDDFVIATGETHSGHEWLDLTCKHYELNKDEVIVQDKKLFRPNEVNVLIGDASKAKEKLGWELSMTYEELNNKMCEYDWRLESTERNLYKKADGFVL